MKKRTVCAYLMEGLIFTLMTGSLGHSAIASLHLPVSFWYSAGITIMYYLILSIYLWNIRSSIILFPATIAALWFYIRKFAPDRWRDHFLMFVKWIIQYSLGNVPLEEIYVYPAVWTINAIFAIIFYIIIVKANLFVLPVAAGVAVIGVEWALGHSHIVPYIWLFALSALLLLSAKTHKQLSQKVNMPDYGHWLVSTLPLALAIVATSIISVPADTHKLKWDFLEQTVEDITDEWNNKFGFSKPREVFRLSEAGFPSSSNELGGPVKISDDVVMEVKSPFPLYLRGTVLNEYTGSGWINSISDKRYRFGTTRWNSAKKRAFDLDEPILNDLSEEQKRLFFPSIEVSITHTGIETSVLFNAERCTDIKATRWMSYVPYFNGKGESFTYRPVKEDEPYNLRILLPNTKLEEFKEYLINYIPDIDWKRELPEDLITNEEYAQKLLDIKRYYTEIPPTVPERVIKLARDITAKAGTPLERALAIEEYLKKNYEYTLHPPYTPADRDFVDYFLFELKKGYCTYFATSMAILCRAAGLPARYIEGFATPVQPERGNLYKVKKLNGHAWVEVYFPKVGWIPFDPTPAREEVATNGNTGYGEYYSNYWEEFMDEEYNTTYDLHINISRSSKNIPWWQRYLFAIIAASIIIASLLYIILWYKLRWFTVKRKDPRQQLAKYYHEILWLLSLYGCPVKRGETPYAYARRIDRWLINAAGSMMDISHIIVKSEFGGYEPTEKDITIIRNFYINLENDIKKITGFWPYIIKLLKRSFFPSQTS